MKRIITSTSNEEIKRIRKLKNKKERDANGLFFIEGIHHVIEALDQGAEFEKLIFCPEMLRSEIALKAVNSEKTRNIDVIQVSEMVFQTLASKEGPQGLAATIHQKYYLLEDIGKEDRGIWILLEGVQDPGNLGSILRSMDAVGGRGIVLLNDTTDAYHPTSVRASMGAIFTQNIIRTNIDDFIIWKKKNNFLLIGAICGDGIDYNKIQYPSKMILALGSEQKGLSQQVMAICDILINIPMIGHVDSLNLSNSASIILYEIFNQQRMNINIEKGSL